MRRLKIYIHYVKDVNNSEFKFPAEELKSLFATSQIQLSFEERDSIQSDPKNQVGYEGLLKSLIRKDKERLGRAPHPGDPAHFIVAQNWEETGGSHVNGYMLHRFRAMATVFTKSRSIRRGKRAVFEQVCAHEVGHMLNLVHGDTGVSSPTTMNTASSRPIGPDEVEDAWDSRGFEAKPPVGFCLPFSARSKEWLSRPIGAGRNGQDDVYPWGVPFKEEDDLIIGRADHNLAIDLTPEQEKGFIGEHLSLRITLKNNGEGSRLVPKFLGSMVISGALFC